MAKYLDYILVGGQSNAGVHGSDASTLPPDLQKRLPNLIMWRNGAPYAHHAIEGTNGNNAQYDLPSADYGYELGFGTEYFKKFGRPLLVIKHAYGSTTLAQRTPGLDWSPNTSGELFDALMQKHDDAMSYYGARGVTLRPNLFIWAQGEGDALAVASGDAYQANFAALKAAVATHVGAPMPWMATLLRTAAFGGAARDRANEVRAALVSESDYTVDLNGYPAPDGTHVGPSAFPIGVAMFNQVYP